MTTHPKHKHALGLPKTVPKNRNFSLFSKLLLLRRLQTHFEARHFETLHHIDTGNLRQSRYVSTLARYMKVLYCYKPRKLLTPPI